MVSYENFTSTIRAGNDMVFNSIHFYHWRYCNYYNDVFHYLHNDMAYRYC